MRVLFLGSPGRFSARALWGCLDAGHEVCEFWYSPKSAKSSWRSDRWLGRWNPGWSVSAALAQHCISRRPVGVLRKNVELWQRVRQLNVELIVSAEFMYVVPAEMLRLVPGRAVNLHPTMLPEYRGPCPLVWMLYHQAVNRCGGVTLHLMTPELDDGPIVAQVRTPWNALGFRHWEADLGRAAHTLLVDRLPEYLAGRITPRTQPTESASYFRGIKSGQLQIDRSLTATRIEHLLETIGSFLALRVQIEDRSFKLAGFDRVVAAAPTGRPPRVGPLRIELDVDDARVALRRWIPGLSKLRRLRTFRTFASMPPRVCPAGIAASVRGHQPPEKSLQAASFAKVPMDGLPMLIEEV